MNFFEFNNVAYRKNKFKAGDRVELVEMDDKQAPTVGTRGTVKFVDDVGTIHIHWDTGSSLGAVMGVDIVKKVRE